MPAQGVLRTSGLSSHPPYQAAVSPPPIRMAPVPPPPERRPPERPARPRRASVPSLVLNQQEMEAADAAVTELGLRNAHEQQSLDTDNIGFAVTNGSHPRRRSQSVGATPEWECRVSPVQGRPPSRRRSEEIRYWRASADLTALGLKGLDSPRTAHHDDNDTVDDGEAAIGEHNGDFDFELQGDTLHNQERIGLEERIVTLEIRLMDLDYAISKMQAESTQPSRRHSQPVETRERRNSIETDLSSERLQAPSGASPNIQQGSPTMTSQWVKDITPKARPTSVATTLKPGYAGHPGVLRKGSIDHSTRSSLTALTIEHYTTLITLLRNEQSARQRLEQQVSILQGRLDALSPPHSSHSHEQSVSYTSHSRSLSSSQRRQGYADLRAGKQMRPPRRRSSSYSTNETDTDDDAFHDAYVTPSITPVERERGEYERGAFDRIAGVEEGMAF